MNKINATLREKMSTELTNLSVDVNMDDSREVLRDIFMNGCTGYVHMSDEDLIEEFENMIDFLPDYDEAQKLLQEAEAEIALHDTLTQTV